MLGWSRQLNTGTLSLVQCESWCCSQYSTVWWVFTVEREFSGLHWETRERGFLINQYSGGGESFYNQKKALESIFKYLSQQLLSTHLYRQHYLINSLFQNCPENDFFVKTLKEQIYFFHVLISYILHVAWLCCIKYFFVVYFWVLMKYYFQPPGGSYEVSRMFHCTVPAPQLPIFCKRGPLLITHHELLIALTHLVS